MATEAKALSVLESYDRARYNVLVPTTHIQQVSPWHAIRVSEVRIDPDPDRGDVYKVGSRQNAQGQWEDLFSPAKPALMRIAQAAGIVWNWRESGPEQLTRDYVVYKAVGAVRLPDGSWMPIMARKEIDLLVIEEETREANRKKAQDLAAKGKIRDIDLWVEAQTHAAMIQWRKNKLARAETGAMLRVIRAALGMRSQYTREELAKPFIVPRTDFSPDYNDPAVREALIQHGMAQMAALFGQSSPAAALPAGQNGGQAAPFREPIDASVVVDDDPFEGAGGADEDPGAGDLSDAGPVGPASAPGAQATFDMPDTGAQSATRCAVCGAAVPDRVAEYSIQHYGKVLCMNDQPHRQPAARRGGGAA